MTNSPPEVAGEREAFEAWRRRTTKMDPDGAVALRGLGEDSGYDNTYTRCMHMAWMARAALSAPAVEPVAVMEALPSDGDFARMAKLAGAKINWNTEPPEAPVFPQWSDWGRFCDRIRELQSPSSPAEQAATQAEAKSSDLINCLVCQQFWHGPVDSNGAADSECPHCAEQNALDGRGQTNRIIDSLSEAQKRGLFAEPQGFTKPGLVPRNLAAPTTPTGAQAEPEDEQFGDEARELLNAEQAAPKAEPQEIMFLVYDYARISDGIDRAEGDARKQQLAAMLAKANEIRAALATPSTDSGRATGEAEHG